MLFRSSIGKKIVMAITGLVWIGYLLLHMYGNLKVFAGADAFNHYAESLRTLGEPVLAHGHLLMLVRIVLAISLALHVWAAIALKAMAMRARPRNYATYEIVEANYATVTMRWGGAAIAAFTIYHLAHFTWGMRALQNDFVRGEPYHNLISGFQNPLHVALYLAALTVVGLHLYHGTWSFFQTMGLRRSALDPGIRALSLVLALAISIGFATVPISVAARLVG